jgi:chloride channel protein, CIC family
VVDRRSRQVSGTLSLQELLHGRTRSVERESERLRLFGYIPPEEGGHN